MAHVAVVAAPPPAVLLGWLQQAGHDVTLIAPERLDGSTLLDGRPPVVAAMRGSPAPVVAALARQTGVPWIAWNLDNNPNAAVAAYEAGAHAVLPAEITQAVLLRSLAAMAGEPSPSSTVPTGAHRPQRYTRGQRVLVAPEGLLVVQDGIVALTAVHPDGTEVLLGFCGPGQVAVGQTRRGLPTRTPTPTSW
ncbi:cyclic nucleotide-binding domain-containing protein [Frankia sp. CiP3]|uniref:cyclic nucleotide-binding domain-containing protein n=1 Tax=Frankia sp. CiP3 TaxID=2880971 RepID=UPI001EF6BEE4|nr:cyclic nucleotide-binding domain-containing protein [Frankia sp. CiP3]